MTKRIDVVLLMGVSEIELLALDPGEKITDRSDNVHLCGNKIVGYFPDAKCRTVYTVWFKVRSIDNNETCYRIKVHVVDPLPVTRIETILRGETKTFQIDGIDLNGVEVESYTCDAEFLNVGDIVKYMYVKDCMLIELNIIVLDQGCNEEYITVEENSDLVIPGKFDALVDVSIDANVDLVDGNIMITNVLSSGSVSAIRNNSVCVFEILVIGDTTLDCKTLKVSPLRYTDEPFSFQFNLEAIPVISTSGPIEHMTGTEWLLTAVDYRDTLGIVKQSTTTGIRITVVSYTTPEELTTHVSDTVQPNETVSPVPFDNTDVHTTSVPTDWEIAGTSFVYNGTIPMQLSFETYTFILVYRTGLKHTIVNNVLFTNSTHTSFRGYTRKITLDDFDHYDGSDALFRTNLTIPNSATDVQMQNMFVDGSTIYYRYNDSSPKYSYVSYVDSGTYYSYVFIYYPPPMQIFQGAIDQGLLHIYKSNGLGTEPVESSEVSSVDIIKSDSTVFTQIDQVTYSFTSIDVDIDIYTTLKNGLRILTHYSLVAPIETTVSVPFGADVRINQGEYRVPVYTLEHDANLDGPFVDLSGTALSTATAGTILYIDVIGLPSVPIGDNFTAEGSISYIGQTYNITFNMFYRAGRTSIVPIYISGSWLNGQYNLVLTDSEYPDLFVQFDQGGDLITFDNLFIGSGTERTRTFSGSSRVLIDESYTLYGIDGQVYHVVVTGIIDVDSVNTVNSCYTTSIGSVLSGPIVVDLSLLSSMFTEHGPAVVASLALDGMIQQGSLVDLLLSLNGYGLSGILYDNSSVNVTLTNGNLVIQTSLSSQSLAGLTIVVQLLFADSSLVTLNLNCVEGIQNFVSCSLVPKLCVIPSTHRTILNNVFVRLSRFLDLLTNLVGITSLDLEGDVNGQLILNGKAVLRRDSGILTGLHCAIETDSVGLQYFFLLKVNNVLSILWNDGTAWSLSNYVSTILSSIIGGLPTLSTGILDIPMTTISDLFTDLYICVVDSTLQQTRCSIARVPDSMIQY